MRAQLAILLMVALALPVAAASPPATPSAVCAPSGYPCTVTLALKSASVADVQTLLARVVRHVQVITTSAAKSVTLVGPNADVTTAIKIVAAFDGATGSPPDKKTDVDQICTIDNVSPDAAQSVAEGVSRFLNGGSGASPVPAATGSQDFTASSGSVILDSSQTRIFVHAPKSAIDNLRLLLRTFTNTSYTKQVYAAYEVRYAVPEPIPLPSNSPAAGAVSSVSGQTIGTSSVQDLANTVAAVMNQSGTPNVQVTPDRSYPRILLSGPEQGVNHALSLLQKLDRKPPVIQFNAQVFSINADTANALGLSLPSTISGTVGAYNAPPSGSTTATPAPLFAGKIVTIAGPSPTVALNTLLQQGAAQVIAQPRVSTVNGHMAVIDVGQVIPFAASGTSSNGNVSASVFNYVIGTHLEMIPMLNYDDSISVYIHPVNSTFTGFTNQNAPQFDRREMSATYRLKFGQAVYLSGLEETDDSETRNQVPILNLIPFLGKHLFGSHSYNRTRTQLQVIITASVLDQGDYNKVDEPSSVPSSAPGVPLKLQCTWLYSPSATNAGSAQQPQDVETGAAVDQGEPASGSIPNVTSTPAPFPTVTQPPPPQPPTLEAKPI